MPTPQEDYRTIELTQGQVTIVDAEDYDWLMQWKWFAAWNTRTKTFYVQRNVVRDGMSNGVIQMQRQILGLEQGDKRKGDHADGNTLDNRRSNLRIATHAQNRANSRTSCASGLKGAYFKKASKRWQGQIRVNGVCLNLGYYDSAAEAHAAYTRAAKEHFGEFARVG